MKSYLIVILILSLSLVGSFSNSYAATGDFITSFNGTGITGGGTPFVFPYLIAVNDINDRIFVADGSLNIVQIYDSNGVFLNSFNGSDSGTPFGNLAGIAITDDGRIVVADNDLTTIQIFNPDGSFVSSFDGSDGDGIPFSVLQEIAVDSNDRIIVIDAAESTVQIYKSDGTFVTNLVASPAFNNPNGLAVGSEDNIIVSDTFTDTVYIFNPDGSLYLGFNGTVDDGSTPFSNPLSLTVDNNRGIIVADAVLGTIQIFDPFGNFIDSFDGTGTNGGGTPFVFVWGVAVDSDNRIFVTDILLDIVQIYEGYGLVPEVPEVPEEPEEPEFGEFVTRFDGSDGDGISFTSPSTIAVDSRDNIIVSDNGIDIVQVYDSEGVFLRSYNGTGIYGGGTPLVNPAAIAVDDNNSIIVGDTGLDIVQIFGGFNEGIIETGEPNIGEFAASFDGSDGDGILFDSPFGIVVDTNDRIIVIDTGLDIVQIYDPLGIFITSFNGTGISGGGVLFSTPTGIAVDNQDRILVVDSTLDLVQIYDSEGIFIDSFDGSDGGGTPFDNPRGIAVDDYDRIIVVNDIDLRGSLDLLQIFDPFGNFLDSFNATDGTPFDNPRGIKVDSNNRIIISDTGLDIVQIFGGYTALEAPESEGEDDQITSDDSPAAPESVAAAEENSGSGGCADCTSPTIGVNSFNKRVVDDGFSYNGNSIQVERWHTPFPLINATVGEINTVQVIIYENQGRNNMKLVQFGLGGTEIGQPLSETEVLIEVWFNLTDAKIGIEEIIINDKDNLIESSTVSAVDNIVKCTADSQNKSCLKVTLQYSYREATINNIMIVNVRDVPGNSQNFYLNEGVQVLGESLNEPPTYIIQNRKTSQQTEDLTLTLTRTDKVNHIWEDKYGIEYLQVSSDRFDRLTPQAPIECTDPPLSEINVPTRQNCNFRAQMTLWG